MNTFKNYLLLTTTGLLLATGCKKDDTSGTPSTGGGGGATASIGNVESAPIPNQYIFVMNMTPQGSTHQQRLNNVMSSINGLLSTVGIPLLTDVKAVFSDALTGFVANVSAAQAAVIAQNGMIKYYEQDQILGYKPFNILFPTPVTQPAQTVGYGVQRTGRADGTGKRAWIIDTGIDFDHADLNVNQSLSRSFSTSLSANDDNGHGTHVAGIVGAKDNTIGVVGVAPNATLIAVKVLASNGSGQTSDVIRGVDYTAANATAGDAANISLGGGLSVALDDAVLALGAKGVRVAIAAGNSGQPVSTTSPARVDAPNVYSVSACDANDNLASFSNYGPSVDFAEPGVQILSTYNDGMYRTLSGTSMASPHLCGLLLIINGSPRNGGTVRGDKDSSPDVIGIK
ncbi:MAG: S8 family peptidase [Sphingobacteriales bacterium]|nr:MAG: S8 family peptidase [Sphingobacteriales bacterium]